MTHTEHPNCLIHQSACGRIAGEPVCPKCGLDERIRYVSEEARLLAVKTVEAQYWECHAKTLEEKLNKQNAPPPSPVHISTPLQDREVGQTLVQVRVPNLFLESVTEVTLMQGRKKSETAS